MRYRTQKVTLFVVMSVICTPFLWAQAASPEGIQETIELLDAKYLDDRTAAQKKLQTFGLEAEPFLIEGLTSSQYRIRLGCVTVLTAMKSEKSLDLIGDMYLRTSDPHIRIKCITYLTAMGSKADQFWIKTLQSIKMESVTLAIGKLRDTKCAEAASQIIILFKETESQDVQNTIFEYFAVVPAQSLPFLKEDFLTLSEENQIRAISLFRQARYEGVWDLMFAQYQNAPQEKIRKACFEYLSATLRKTVPAFLAIYDNCDESVQTQVLHMARSLRDADAVDVATKSFLSTENAELFNAALLYLKSIRSHEGAPFIQGCSSKVYTVRRSSVLALEYFSSEKAMDALVERLTDTHEEIVRLAFEQLLSKGAVAHELVFKAVKEKRIDGRFAERIHDQKLYIRVEMGLLDLIAGGDSGEYSYGFFDDQFVHVGKIKDRKKVLNILFDMMQGTYAYKKTIPPRKIIILRDLASMALGELGDAEIAERIEHFINKMEKTANIPAGVNVPEVEKYTVVKHTLYVSAYRLGKKQFVEADLERLLNAYTQAKEASNFPLIREMAYRCANYYNRIGEDAKAESMYAECIDAILKTESITEENKKILLQTMYYNLACVLTEHGKPEEAIKELTKSVDAGYDDWQWAIKDGDLRVLRNTDEFKSIIERMKSMKETKRRNDHQ